VPNICRRKSGTLQIRSTHDAGDSAETVSVAGRLQASMPWSDSQVSDGKTDDALGRSVVIERGLDADGRIYRFDALISDRPGGLAHLSKVLADAGANATGIVRNRTFSGPDLVACACALHSGKD
jgi:hypothetical protein